ncbi:MAG: substrate-binding periplasmic protein, partial [Thiohalomonadales bacterium]
VYAADTIVLNQSGGPPLNDLKLTGFMDRIAQEAFSRLNVKLEIVQLPAERSLINSNKGIIDGEMGRIAGLNSKYKNLVQVNEKIMDWEFVVYSNKKINLNNGWNSLIPYTVAIINGWKILEKNVPSEVELTKVKYQAQLFGMLKLHRSDLIIYEKWSGKYYLKKNNITDVKLIPRPLITKELFIYLNKKHSKLAVKLASSLKSMKDDGTYKKIESETLKKLE